MWYEAYCNHIAHISLLSQLFSLNFINFIVHWNLTIGLCFSVHLVELQGTGELFAMKAMDKSVMLNRNKVFSNQILMNISLWWYFLNNEFHTSFMRINSASNNILMWSLSSNNTFYFVSTVVDCTQQSP